MSDPGEQSAHLWHARRPNHRLDPVDTCEVFIFGLLAIGLAPCGRLVIALFDSREDRGARGRIGHRGGAWERGRVYSLPR